MEVDKSTISEALQRRRKELKLSQDSVARRAGIRQSYLSAIERGKIDARIGTLTDIARAMRSELVLIPNETLSLVRSIASGSRNDKARPLISIDPD
jgi:predicted transcriptional regulator